MIYTTYIIKFNVNLPDLPMLPKHFMCIYNFIHLTLSISPARIPQLVEQGNFNPKVDSSSTSLGFNFYCYR